MATNHTLINDFVGLPIIVSDFDALTSNSTANQDLVRPAQPASPTREPSTLSTTSSSAEAQQNWSTGFSDFADGIWAKMTQGMKKRLRDACVEVLKKTEEAEPEHMSWQYDDDARFLD